jgi:hypothetical protein
MTMGGSKILSAKWVNYFCPLTVVRADASKQRHHQDDDDDWGGGSRAINEYLDAIEADGAPASAAKKVSQTDPMARWTAEQTLQRPIWVRGRHIT